jgi:sugar lactone lactonase YvrE
MNTLFNRATRWVMAGLMITVLTTACDDDDDEQDGTSEQLTVVANSSTQWTGIAVSREARVFANYPNWKEGHTVSVIETTDTTNMKPFPDQTWNQWKDGMNPAQHFICVQSVFVDHDNFLWVLDPANPQRMGEYLGVVPGGAKLVKIDLSTNAVVKTIVFSEPVIEKNSYLNDIRIDEGKQIGYMTDSNEGALVVVNLQTGAAWRKLALDPTTKSENRILRVEGSEVRNEQGEYVNFHSDGIALNPDRTFLYWRPINGESLYRISTAMLNNAETSDATLSENIEDLGDFPPSDGMIFGKDGRLYLTSIEENAVRALHEGDKASRIVVQSDDLKWPDSFAVGEDGTLYVTTSQIHIKNPEQPYRIFKFLPD